MRRGLVIGLGLLIGTVGAVGVAVATRGAGVLAGALELPAGGTGATATLELGDDPIRTVELGADGAFRFERLAMGMYTLRFSIPAPEGLPKGWGYVGPAEDWTTDIPVSGVGEMDLGRLPVQRVEARIRVRSAPVVEGLTLKGSDAAVWVAAPENPRGVFADSDAQGVALVDLPWVRESVPVCVTVAEGYRERGVASPAVQVVPKIWDTIEVSIPVGHARCADTTLQVVDAQGTPLPGVEVQLLMDGPSDAMPQTAGAVGGTDADGRVLLSAVPVGTRRFAVRSPGGAWSTHPIEVSAEGLAPAQIVVPGGTSVSFTIGLTLGDRPFQELLRKMRERTEAHSGAAANRRFPARALFLVDTESRRLWPASPEGAWLWGKEAEAVVVTGVPPGRYRAVVAGAFEPSQGPYGNVMNVGRPLSALSGTAGRELVGGGLPPLISDPFDVPASGSVEVKLSGNTSLERAAELAGAWPPRDAISATTLAAGLKVLSW